MDLAATPIKGLPRNEDLLLLWRTSLEKLHSDNAWVVFRGVIFLKATSAVADKPYSPVSPEVPKTLPGSSLSGTSVSASTLDEPWFNPPGGTWIPNPAVVSDMKVALDAALRPILAERGEPTQPQVRYWFQYIGQGSGAKRTIGFLGHPVPVPQGAGTTFYGAYIPEACHVQARYVPSQRRIEDLVVGGFHCPRRM